MKAAVLTIFLAFSSSVQLKKPPAIALNLGLAALNLDLDLVALDLDLIGVDLIGVDLVGVDFVFLKARGGDDRKKECKQLDRCMV